MAGALKTTRTTDLQTSKRWKEREISPERTKIWTEPSSNKVRSSDRKVPVIYYLSRNGQLDHPHFMEVPFSSRDGGLYLRDVINRLNFLRGKGMASMYSWSSKRGYKNGYVWHDLSENDFIYPAHGQEYILKGSELLETETTLPKSDETVTFTPIIKPPPETTPKHDHHGQHFAAAGRRRRNQSWSSFDLHEYKVYSRDSTGRVATDASTQTDDRRRRRRAIREIEEEVDEDRETTKVKEQLQQGNQMAELSTDEIFEVSPPPSDSSPETLETLLKADGRLISRPETTVNENPTPNNNHPIGRGKASTVLMQLLSCGSIGFKDCGPGNGKENGFSLVSHYKVRLPRGGAPNQVRKDTASSLASRFGGRLKLEDKEYFSGSLIETKKDEFLPTLKRSSSYNADRSSQLELGVKEMMEGSRAKCMPRKPKNTSTKKESNSDLSCCTTSSSSSITCSSQHGSKRIVVQT